MKKTDTLTLSLSNLFAKDGRNQFSTEKFKMPFLKLKSLLASILSGLLGFIFLLGVWYLISLYRFKHCRSGSRSGHR